MADARIVVGADGSAGSLFALHCAETASLLVVGSRTVRGLPGRPAGSVGAQVATGARCSVVMVRGSLSADCPVLIAR